MCHSKYLSLQPPRLSHYLLHLHSSKVLAMADRALILLLALKLKDNHLIAPSMSRDGAAHTGCLERIAQDHFIGIVRNRKDSVKLYRAADISRQRFYFNRLAGRHAILLTARLNHSVHNTKTFSLGFGSKAGGPCLLSAQLRHTNSGRWKTIRTSL